jgi:hypothetical protein
MIRKAVWLVESREVGLPGSGLKSSWPAEERVQACCSARLLRSRRLLGMDDVVGKKRESASDFFASFFYMHAAITTCA